MTDKSTRRWYATYRAIMRPVVRLTTHIEIQGNSHVPERGPFILVSNHRSNQDPLVLGSALQHHIRWVVAGYMRNVPVAGWVMERMGVIYLGRARGRRRSFLQEGTAILERGGVVGIFPEGEAYIFQNDFNAPMVPFHRGFAALAVRSTTPVLPVVIRPVQEVLRPIKIPPAARAHLPSEGVANGMRIPRYKSVQLAFGSVMRPGSGGGAEEELNTRVRAAMESLQKTVA